MMAFIDQEASEKAEEIDAKVRSIHDCLSDRLMQTHAVTVYFPLERYKRASCSGVTKNSWPLDNYAGAVPPLPFLLTFKRLPPKVELNSRGLHAMDY